MFISLANSISFALRDSNLPNRENTLSYEEKYSGSMIKRYCQTFKDDDVVTVQVGSNSAVVPTIQVYQPELTTSPTASLESSYIGNIDPTDDRYYFEFDIDFSLYTNKTIQVKVTQGAVIYLSEYLSGIDLDTKLANGKMLKLVYQNSAKPSDYLNFTIDYTTGIAFFFYVESILKKFIPQGEEEVFNGISEKTLLEAQLYRGKTIETDIIPEFLAEKIMIAGKHFYFLINDIQYITEGMPDVEPNGSNFSSLSWTVIQQNVLGFSTDNRELIGLDMEAIIQRKNESVTSTWSFVVPKEYMLHEIFASHNASSLADYVLDVGTTIGGSELLDSGMCEIPLSGGQSPIPFIIHEQLDYSVDTTIYVTITGASAIADIRAQLILNN